MTLHLFLLYLATWSLVALSPGPAAMCVMSQSTRYGFRAALAGLLGIQSGHFIFFGCVALGLGAYAWFAARGVRSLRSSRAVVWLERAFGATLLFFGVRLLATRK